MNHPQISSRIFGSWRKPRLFSLRAFPPVVFGLSLSLSLLPTIPAHAESSRYLVYVSSDGDKGSQNIYAYRFNAKTGQLAELGVAAQSTDPSFLTTDPNGHFLYAVNAIDNYEGKISGAISSFAIDAASGKLSLLNQVSSRSSGPAHITLDQTGKFALVSNYPRGSVAVFPLLKNGRLGEASAFVQHNGSSVDKERQEAAHAHAAAFSPDNRFAVVADLGLDQVITYSFDAVKGTLGDHPQITKARPGSGPRHLVFGPTGKFLYVINEMQSTVVTYAYNPGDGALREVSTVSALPDGFSGHSDAAEIAIHPSGKFLYASNRGHDSIAVFSISPATGTLTPVEFASVNGKTPRHFAIDPTGSWLLAANQRSDNLVVFRVNRETGRLIPTGQVFHLPSPVCVQFVPLH